MPHSIALKGPWRVTGIDRLGHSIPTARLVIREPQDWERWLPVLGCSENLQSVKFERAFNWPAADRPAIALTLKGAQPNRIFLNQVELSFSWTAEATKIRIEPLIETNNQLSIEFDLTGLAHQPLPSRLLSDAMLLIESEA